MVAFLNLVPALFLNATINNPIPVGVGQMSTGSQLTFGNVISGSLKSEEGFETPIKGELLYTNDFPTIDPDLQHARLNFKGLIKTDDGDHLEISATAIQDLDPRLTGIFTGATRDNLPFGATQAVAIVSFRTGSKKYKSLQDSIFVGSETVKANDGKSFGAGIKISKVYSAKTDVTLDRT